MFRVKRRCYGDETSEKGINKQQHYRRAVSKCKFECFTLEDRVRPVKIKGETAIPLALTRLSLRFQTASRNHCRSKDMVGKSRAAFDSLFAKIKAAAQKEKIFIEIVNEEV